MMPSVPTVHAVVNSHSNSRYCHVRRVAGNTDDAERAHRARGREQPQEQPTGNVASAGWQVTLCDPTRVSVAVRRLCELLYTYLLSVHWCRTKLTALCDCRPWECHICRVAGNTTVCTRGREQPQEQPVEH